MIKEDICGTNHVKYDKCEEWQKQPWKLENLNIGKNKPQNVKNEGMEQNYEFESEASFSNRNKCEHKH